MRNQKKQAISTDPVRLDPLYVVFEQHLYNFQDSTTDRKTFIARVVYDYLSLIRRRKVAVPPTMEKAIVEELAVQVNTMLVKKIYGCLSIQDYQKTITKKQKRKTSSKYMGLKTQVTGSRSVKTGKLKSS